jgi:nucleoid-associated protein Lsr2
MKTETDQGRKPMAQKVMLIDDLDGSDGVETIRYSVDGKDYEIDLSEKNAERFRSTLREFIDVSREVEQPPVLTLTPGRARRRSTGGSGRDDIPQIRAWAESQSMDVNARGRIKNEIIDAYDQAHS